MNYIGSKQKLSQLIFQTIQENFPQTLSKAVFCDLFAGSGVVGKTFKKYVKSVIANDMEYYSYVLNRNLLGNTKDLHVKLSWIKKLNSLEPKKGFIYNNYSFQSGRSYFSDANAQKIDAVRFYIQELYNSETIDEDCYFFLLASLLESSDKVANTASIYASCLKELKKSAQKDLILEAAGFEESDTSHQVYNQDALELIKSIKGDILYLDPPYNKREYGLNYHLLNTIALYDSFEPKGKGGLREYKRSSFCKINKVTHSLEKIFETAQFSYIFLSYNNEGYLCAQDIKTLMQKYGKYSFVKFPYRRFAINQKHKIKFTDEYLHILKK